MNIQAFIIVLFLLVIYFTPYLIGRKKRNAQAILALNFFAGWTIIGWIAAFVWASIKDEPAKGKL